MDSTQADQTIRRYRNASLVLALAIPTAAALLIRYFLEAELLPTILFWIIGVHQLFYVAWFSLLALTSLPFPRPARILAATAAVIFTAYLAVATFLLFPPSWLSEEARLGAILVFIIVAGFRELRALFPRRDGKPATRSPSGGAIPDTEQ